MAHQLSMDKSLSIKSLRDSGLSERAIAGALGVSRNAVRRHELRSTVMTSNRPLEDWGQLIGDIPSATAILDRFPHRAEVVQITGKSCRLEKSEQSPKGTKAPTGSRTAE